MRLESLRMLVTPTCGRCNYAYQTDSCRLYVFMVLAPVEDARFTEGSCISNHPRLAEITTFSEVGYYPIVGDIQALASWTCKTFYQKKYIWEEYPI